MDKREGEVSRFLSEFFCLTVPYKFVLEPFRVSLISGIENVRMREWGECEDFPSNLCFLRVPKIFVG